MTEEKYRLVSESQWRYLHQKLNLITDEMVKLSQRIDNMQKSKRYLKFAEALPPASICRDALSMLYGTKSYEGMLGRLSEFYCIETMGCYVDKNINPKYSAEYRPTEKAAYTRKKIVSESIVLHEFFHHLIYQNVVIVPKKEEEKHADKYAKIVLERAGWKND